MPDEVVDRRAFDALAGELGSLASARRIATLYLSLLDTRVARLVAACDAEDAASAMDAVLSLKVSSATVGAAQMCDRATEVEDRLLTGGCRSARSALEQVRCAGPTTATAVATLIEIGRAESA